ncbi:MAG: hypothetical protein IT318_22055 [Anaerolineales bacterium]|nr:hypothetical protein [Anaerolineales bacterium]
MTSEPDQKTVGDPIYCANCHFRLDLTDKFCRECGLPTVHRAHTQRSIPAEPPDTLEFRRAMEVAADPQPFVRPAVDDRMAGGKEEDEALTTGSVVRVTSPTQATRAALSTALMVGLIVVFVVIGLVLLVLAFQV